LTIRHTRGHMTRSVLEGVAFGLKDSFSLIKQAGLADIREVRASGGGTKGALWRQILSSVLECDLQAVACPEGAAYGAALLAGVGQGVWQNVADACRETVKIIGVTRQDPAMVEVYQKTYPLFRDLYPALKPSFQKMSS
jgi:xylulokinase